MQFSGLWAISGNRWPPRCGRRRCLRQAMLRHLARGGLGGPRHPRVWLGEDASQAQRSSDERRWRRFGVQSGAFTGCDVVTAPSRAWLPMFPALARTAAVWHCAASAALIYSPAWSLEMKPGTGHCQLHSRLPESPACRAARPYWRL